MESKEIVKLIKQAAVAANIEIIGPVHSDRRICCRTHTIPGHDPSDLPLWNAWCNNGDAFALAIHLGIEYDCCMGSATAYHHELDMIVDVDIGTDKYAAVREAIVRLAALMGNIRIDYWRQVNGA